MESQHKDSGGDEVTESGTTTVAVAVAVAKKRKMRGCDLFMRVVAAVLSLTAVVVLVFDKETTAAGVTVVPFLPEVGVSITAEWHYLSAFVYFMVANSIACLYAIISLLLIIVCGCIKKKVATTVIVVFDLMIVVILFSSIGAVIAIGLIGLKGNSHVQWNKVCNVLGKFCRQGAIALGFSGVASIVFFLLVLGAILNHRKKT